MLLKGKFKKTQGGLKMFSSPSKSITLLQWIHQGLELEETVP